MYAKILSLFFFPMSLSASLSLYNDSVFFLTVKVLGANGAKIGEEIIVPSGGHIYMEDQIGTSDPVGQGEAGSSFHNYTNSLTPYQVFWYCRAGTLYSCCLDAAAGATVTASTCPGNYYCEEGSKES